VLVPAKPTTVTIRNDNPDIVTVPTSLTIDSGGNAELNITANKKGIAKVTASLADGTVSNTLTINVTSTATGILTPNVTDVELGMEETTTFMVDGGTGHYTWSVQGGGTIDKMTGNQVTYLAPDHPGSVEVVVTDGKQTATIQVNVTDDLRLYPNQVDLKKGEQVILKVLGGNGQVAPIDGDTDSVLVTAPNALGEFFIEVYDESLAKTAPATLNVVDGPLLSPKEVEVTQAGVPKNIEIQQGSPPFTVLVDKGEAKLVGRQVQISPPVENGTYKLTVIDAIGGVAEADINVKIPGRLEISPVR
jgi:hypothetical protein